jgi:hypothetical protein
MRGGRAWTSEDIQHLRELAASGATVPDMSKKLDRSEASIRTRTSVLKIRVAASGHIRLKANK